MARTTKTETIARNARRAHKRRATALDIDALTRELHREQARMERANARANR